jgi:hypothetical protein
MKKTASNAIEPRIPSCPKCLRNHHVEEEQQSGSSDRWFLCAMCGTRFNVPPRKNVAST